MSSTKSIALGNYKVFAEKDGNQHIAGVFAVQTLYDLILKNDVKRVLEVGLGIGFICHAIHDFSKKKNRKLSYTGTEDNAFCLDQLPDNLNEHYSNLKLLENLDGLGKQDVFDLIIIDGSDDSLETVKNHIAKHGIVYIEGHRGDQVQFLQEIFPNCLYVLVSSNYKNPPYGPYPKNHWSTGGRVIYVNPTVKQRLSYLYYKVRNSFIFKVYRKFSK